MAKGHKKFRLVSIFTVICILFTSIIAVGNTSVVRANSTWTFYVYDLNKYHGIAKMADWYDESLFVSTLQGIVNQDGPNLYIRDYNTSVPMTVATQYQMSNTNRNWLDKLTKKGQWLSEANIVVLSSIDDLISTFRSKLSGVVVWDPKVDSTVNVATTIAGVERTPIVMGGGELYTKVTSYPNNLIVQKNLVGMFSGVNSKTNAYAWAKTNYLDNGLSDAGVLSSLEDGYVRQPGATNPQSFTVERDIIVKKKGFAFDLSCWGDEKPNDAPDQTIGNDRNMFLSILQKAYDLKGQVWPIDIYGFVPWWDKYSDYLGRGLHGPMAGEWKTAEEYSKKNAGMLTVVDWVGCSNASFHSWAPVGKGMINVPKAPARRTLENKTYILYVSSDFDGGFFHNLASVCWDDKKRGTIPIYWGITPGIYKDYPDLLQYIYDSATPNDYLGAGPSGVQYSNPDFIPNLDIWTDYNREAYKRSGFTMSSFVLNGNAGIVSSNVEKSYSTFSGDGISILQTQMTNPQAAVRNDNMAISELIGSGGYFDVNATANGINSYAASLPYVGSQPNFITLRHTFLTPSHASDIQNKITADHPEYNYEVVDPYTFYSLIRQAKDNQTHDAIELSSDIPDKMVAGASFNVTVKMRNVGSSIWTKTSLDRLGSSPNNQFIWSNLNGGYSNSTTDQRVFLSDSESIAPQQLKTWSYTVTAPALAGSYSFAAQMVRDGTGWMGSVYSKTVNVVAATGDQAVVTSVTVPDILTEGSSGTVSVIMKNVGSTTWTASNNFRLGAGNYPDPFYYKTMSNQLVWTGFPDGGFSNSLIDQRVYLSPSDSIAPGQSKTFSFNVTAPSRQGRYIFSGEMIHDGTGWFGSSSRFEKEIKVVPSGRIGFESGLIDSTVPVYMKANTKQLVTISFKNVGTETWTSGNNYMLASTSSNQLVFSDFKDGGISNSVQDNRVYLGSSDQINTEDSKSFTFAINAPSTPGSYVVSVDMLHNTTFANKTASFTVNVVNNDYDCVMTNSNFPTTMAAGGKASLLLEFVNVGSNTWRKSESYRLGATNNNQILFTNLNSNTGYSNSVTDQRIYLYYDADVPINQGNKNQFKFNIQAPDIPGTYTLEFKMVRDGVTWFGPTYTYTINVTAGYTKRVNCGGASFTDGSGNAWLADQAYSSGSWGYSGTSGIASTTDMITFNNAKSFQEPNLYKYARKGSSFNYKFDVMNGKYLTVLHFAEIEKIQSFSRLFTVKAENRSIITGFDIYKMNLGHDKAWFPYNRFDESIAVQCQVDVTDGQLNLDFIGNVDNAMVNGIEVVKLN